MIKPDKIFDDMARVAGGTVGLLAGFKEQIQSDVRAYMDDLADRMDLVPREDFDRLEAQVRALHKKIETLESSSKNKTSSKKAPAKSTSSTKKKKKA